MRIGQVVEILIDIRKLVEPLSQQEDALEEACNLLDKLPRMEDANTYEPVRN